MLFVTTGSIATLFGISLTVTVFGVALVLLSGLTIAVRLIVTRNVVPSLARSVASILGVTTTAVMSLSSILLPASFGGCANESGSQDGCESEFHFFNKVFDY